MYLRNKNILVTGACGTVGAELVRQLLTPQHDISRIIGIDNNESGLFFLEQKYIHDRRTTFFLADIRDAQKLDRLMRGVDIVFHTAAFKHVVLCERSPFEAVQTNIIGVQNIILTSDRNSVEKVIFTSTDKAVNPTSVMGTSKLMGEKLMTAANSRQFRGGTVFGPKPRSYEIRMPKKVRRLGLRMALSARFSEDNLRVLDEFRMEEFRTRKFVETMNALELSNALIVVPERDEKLEKSSRNVPGFKVITSAGLNVYDILLHHKLVILEPCLGQLEERLLS